jgi:predicted RNase H-like nuclease (RuvC/YqgF family)
MTRLTALLVAAGTAFAQAGCGGAAPDAQAEMIALAKPLQMHLPREHPGAEGREDDGGRARAAHPLIAATERIRAALDGAKLYTAEDTRLGFELSETNREIGAEIEKLDEKIARLRTESRLKDRWERGSVGDVEEKLRRAEMLREALGEAYWDNIAYMGRRLSLRRLAPALEPAKAE